MLKLRFPGGSVFRISKIKEIMLARQMLFEQDGVNKHCRTLVYQDEFPNLGMVHIFRNDRNNLLVSIAYKALNSSCSGLKIRFAAVKEPF